MTQYINKSAVVAEIERRINEIDEFGTYLSPKGTLTNLLCHLDILEMKEVDLDKEFDNYTKDILACDVQFEPFTHLYNCAKHFYELGLKAKGEPIHPTADEKLLMKEMINSVKHGIEVEKFLKTTKEEESKKEDKIWNVDYF